MRILVLIFILSGALPTWAETDVCPKGLTTVGTSGDLAPRPCLQLSSISFIGDKLTGLSWTGSVFQKVSFREVSMTESRFDSTRLVLLEGRRLKASGSDFGKSEWVGGILTDSDLSKSRFIEAEIRGIKWIRVRLNDSALQRSRWFQCYLEDVNFEGADLRGARFEQCQFVNVNWRGALFNKETKLPFSQSEKAIRGMVYTP